MVAQGIEPRLSGDRMFGDSLLESSWAQRSRRSWTTLTSFGLEALAIGVLLVIPLWKTVGLPSAHTLSTPVSLVANAPARTAAAQPHGGSASPHATTLVIHQMMEPQHIPNGVHNDPVDAAPDPIGVIGTGAGPLTSGPSIPGLAPGGTMLAPPPPAPRAAAPTFRTSSMLQGSLLHQVQPTYPPLAKTARIQGPVVLEAVISKAGAIENLRVISGPPLLVKAALEAVSEWRYRPYILNDEPVEVETRITVNFTLGGS
jgi:protein TonB